MLLHTLLLTWLVLALNPLSDRGDQWPIFRGNAHQTGVAVSGLPEHLEVRWTFKTKDAIESTAAIVNGTVYIGSNDENLYALDLATGKQKWAYKAGAMKAAVAYHDGAVYVGNLDGIFHCVDAATGQKRWTFETGADISSGANFTRDAVLFGSGDETLYCLSREGKLLWKFRVPGGPVLGSPVIVGERTFAAGCDSALHVLDVTNGKQLGNTVDLGGQVGATVAVLGDRLYVGTMSNQVLAIDWKKGAVLWQFEAPTRPQPFYASVAATDKLIIAASRDKRIHALDRETGNEIWHFSTGKKVDSSPVVVGQRVFVGSSDRYLYELSLAQGTELHKYNLKGEITASPAVADNCLVIGTAEGVVYCLGAKP
jgi:outer membrane protein assembly factor BamB